MRCISLSHVTDFGWTGTGFLLEDASPEKIGLTVTPWGQESKPVKILPAEPVNGAYSIRTEDFDYKANWTLTVDGVCLTRQDMAEERCEGAERFEKKQEQGVIYRLYTPEAPGPRPLLLYLHGGGNGGTDNLRQIAADYGCIQFADRYPDFYIMAPQAPERDFSEMMQHLGKMDFAHSDLGGDFGWYRGYLARICGLIRSMIADGRVDGQRVYVTGLSMGGGGTIRAMSVGAGLFAAAVAVCPTMTPETFHILKGLTHAKIWIATAYVDHTLYRHKYIVDAVMSLKDAGNRDVHLTIYAPEDLEKYGIATDPNLSMRELVGQNHMSWVPTYHDEYGIMSWLTQQTLH